MKELERRNKGAMEMIMMKTERKRETERRKYTKKKSKKVVLMKQPEFPQDGQLETRVSNLKEIKVKDFRMEAEGNCQLDQRLRSYVFVIDYR